MMTVMKMMTALRIERKASARHSTGRISMLVYLRESLCTGNIYFTHLAFSCIGKVNRFTWELWFCLYFCTLRKLFISEIYHLYPSHENSEIFSGADFPSTECKICEIWAYLAEFKPIFMSQPVHNQFNSTIIE